jgi:hypothetical protein
MGRASENLYPLVSMVDETRRYAQNPDRGSMSEMGIGRQLRHRTVVRGRLELPFWLAFRQRYTTGQTGQHRIRFGNKKLGVEAEGH